MQNQGTLVSAEIRPNDSADQFPTAFASEIKGGFHSVATITVRNAIFPERRELGMRVRVIDESKDYELVGGITNGNWVEVGTGSGGGVVPYGLPLTLKIKGPTGTPGSTTLEAGDVCYGYFDNKVVDSAIFLGGDGLDFDSDYTPIVVTEI